MSADKMKVLAEQLKKGSVTNQEPIQKKENPIEEKSNVKQEQLKNEKELKKEEPTKAPVKRSTRVKKNSLEYAIDHIKEKDFDNIERVYIDKKLMKKIKTLKLTTGVSIGNLTNLMIEIVLNENKDYINEKINDLIN